MTVKNSLRKWLAIFRSAYSSWTATIGTVIATIALCNLIFRVMDASLFETLRWILSAYQKTFHSPFDYLTSMFSLRLPAPVKDAFVLYAAMGGVLYRTLSYERPPPLKDRLPANWAREMRLWSRKIIGALLWPYILKSVLGYPCLLISSSQGYHGRMPPPRSDLSPAERKEVVARMLAHIGDDAVVLCDERELLVSYALSLLVAVTSIVILNAAIEGLG